jgi:hypothetical protein
LSSYFRWVSHVYTEGKVAEITAGRAEVTSNKGNTVHRNGTEEDPAVVIERSGVSEAALTDSIFDLTMICHQNNVVKLAHELNEVDSAKAGK